MFEKSAAQLVEQLCGKYVEGVDAENLKISMWKGEVVMEAVALKSTAFDALQLPITLKKGSIGRLHLQVPWNKLGSAPVTITVEDIDAVIVPQQDRPDCESLEERRKRLQKDFDTLRKTLLTKASDDSYIKQVISGVVDNLIFKFSRINLVYEDSQTLVGSPFVVEVSLGGLSLVTANQDWEEHAFLPGQHVLHKLGQLTDLSVRWKSEASSKPSEQASPLLHPVSATLRLQLSKQDSVAANRPMATIGFEVTRLFVAVDQLMLRDAAMLSASWASHSQRALRAARRPRVGGYRGHAREWWRFAINETLIEVGSGSASMMMKSARMGREYRDLLKRALRVLPLPELTEAEVQRVIEIEDAMPRRFVIATQRGTMVHLRREAEEHIAKHKASEGSPGMLSRWFGGGGGGGRGEEGGGLSQEERKKMEELVEGARAKEAEEAEELENAPPAYVAYAFSFSVGMVGAEVATRAGGGESRLERLTQVRLESMTGGAQMRQSGKMLSASIGRFRVEKLSADGDEQKTKKMLWNEVQFEPGGVPLLAVSLELDPLPSSLPDGKPVDVIVDFKLQRSLLAIDKEWLERMLVWKAALDREVEGSGTARPAASEGNSITTAKQLVKRVGSRRKLVSVTADIHAPTIRVPTDQDTAMLQLGQITVSTQLADGVGPEKRDWFKVALTDVQLLRGNVDELQSANEIVAPVAAFLHAGVATVQDDPNVSQVKAILEVEGVQVGLTQHDARALTAAARQLQLNLPSAGSHSVLTANGSTKDVHGGVKTWSSSVRRLSTEGFAGSVRSILAGEGEQPVATSSPQSQAARGVGGDQRKVTAGIEVEGAVSRMALTLLATREVENVDKQPLLEVTMEGVTFSRCKHGLATDTRLKIGDFDIIHPSSLSGRAQCEQVSIITAKGVEDLLELRVLQTVTVRADQEIQDLEVSMSLGKIKLVACPPAMERIWPHIQRFVPASSESTSAQHAVENEERLEAARGGVIELKKGVEVLKGSQTLTLEISSIDFRLKDMSDLVVTDVLHSHLDEVDLHYIKNRDQSMRFQALLQQFEIENETIGRSSAQHKVLSATVGDDHMATIDYSTAMSASGLLQKAAAKMGRLNFNMDPQFVAHVHRLIAQLQRIEGTSSTSHQKGPSSNSDSKTVANTTDKAPLELDLDLAGFTLFLVRPSNPAEGVQIRVRELNTCKAEGSASRDVVSAGLNVGVVVLSERSAEGSGKQTEIEDCHVLDVEGQMELRRFFASKDASMPADEQFKHLWVDLSKVYVRVEEKSVKTAHAIMTEATESLKNTDQPQTHRTGDTATSPETVSPKPVSTEPTESGCRGNEAGGVAMVLEGVIREFVFSFRENINDVSEGMKTIKKTYQPQTLSVMASGARCRISKFEGGSQHVACELKTLVVECQDNDEHPASTVRDDDDGRLRRRLLSSEAEDRFTRKTKAMQTSMRALFHQHDDSQNSKLNVDELLTTLRDLGVCFSEEQASTLLDQLDDDKDGEVDEEEFLKLVWLSLGEQPPEEDTQTGDAGPPSPDAVDNVVDAKPFVSITHKSGPGGEAISVIGARLEIDLSLEPVGMLLRLHEFVSEVRGGRFESRQATPSPGNKSSVADLFGALSKIQQFKLPFMADRSQAIEASRPPARDISVQLESVEVCVAVDNREENEPAVFLWMRKASFGACVAGGSSAGWKHSIEAVVDGLEIGYADKLIGKYDLQTGTRKEYDAIVQRNTFQYHVERELVVGKEGLNWTKSTKISVENAFNVELSLSHLVFLVTYWTVLRAKSSLEVAESDDEEDEDTADGSRKRRLSAEGARLQLRRQTKSNQQELLKTERPRADAGAEKQSVLPILSQEEDWSFKCSQLNVVLTNDIQSNTPLLRFDVGNLVVNNKVTTSEGVFQIQLDVSCSVHNLKKMAWEPILERWECKCRVVTHQSSPTQHIELSAPTRFEISVAPEHLRTILHAKARFDSAVKQSTADLVTEAPVLARFTSSKQITDDLSNFFATFTPDTTRLFHNRTAIDLRLRVQSENPDHSFFAVLPPTKTASIDCQQIGVLQVQLAMLGDQECKWSRLLPELEAQPALLRVQCERVSGKAPAYLHLLCTPTEILAHPPWALQNLLPKAATVNLHRSPDPLSPVLCSVVAEPGPVQQQHGADLGEELYCSLAVGDSLRTTRTIRVGGVDRCDGCVLLQDDKGRELEVRVSVKQFERSSPVLRIFPQLVMVNRTGLPLVFGRCRDRREAKTGKVELEVNVVGGQRERDDEHLHSAAGWFQWEEGHIRSWIRSAEKRSEATGGAWNDRDPETVLVSLPEGPEWSPCVSIAGADQWIELAHDDPDEGQDVGEAEGRFIKLQGASKYGVDLDGDGTVDRVEEGGEVSYSLGVTMKMGDMPFHRTIYMDFMPMHNLVNRTDRTIQVVQYVHRPQQDIILQVESEMLMSTFGAFHQNEELEGASHRLAIRFVDDAGFPLTHWSGPFNIGEERTFPLRLLTDGNEREAHHVVCEIRRWMNSNFINFLPHDESRPLYQVSNATFGHSVSVWQLGSPLQERGAFVVRPQESRMLSWDDADSLLKLAVRVGASPPVIADMSRLGEKQVVHDGGCRVALQCKIIGGTRCLEIKDIQQQHAGNNNDSLLVSAAVQFGGIGVSIVSSEREEMLYASLQSVHLNITVHDSKVVVDASVDKLHVDNQTDEGPRKAVILPVVGGGRPSQLKASAELCRDVITMPYWNKVVVEGSEFCVQLQEDWLYKLLQFEQGAFNDEASLQDDGSESSILVRAETGSSVELEQRIRTLSFLETAEGGGEQGVHIEELSLGAIEGDVSVYGLYAVPTRPEKPSVGPVSRMYENLRVVQAPMGSVPDIHRHQITLPSLQSDNVAVVKGSSIGGLMWGHYKRSLYRSAVKLMGSADFWANVLGAASDSKASALERQKQKALKRAQGRPDSVGSGLSQGMAAVGEGFLSGLTGIVEKPMEAAKEGGAGGLLQGIGQGLLGAFTKPAAGMLLLGSKVTEGTVAQVKGVERVLREREPRAVYADRQLRAFNPDDAKCYQTLCGLQARQAAPAKEGGQVDFVGYASMEGGKGLLVAGGEVRVVASKELSSSVWSASVSELTEVTWHEAECRLQLRTDRQPHPQVVTVKECGRGAFLAQCLEREVVSSRPVWTVTADGQRVQEPGSEAGRAPSASTQLDAFMNMGGLMPPVRNPS